MNDLNELDRKTFARFAERFARIERQIPDPPALAARMEIGGRGRAQRPPLAGWAAIVVILAAVGGLVVIGSRLLPATVTVPPDSATAAEVLDAYLRAVQAGDCDTAEQLTYPLMFGPSMVDLCGVTGVTAFSVVGDPVVVDPDKVRMNANLTITGTSAISAGEISFTYFLQQQGSGVWRIVDGAGHIPPSMLLLPTATAPPVAPPSGVDCGPLAADDCAAAIEVAKARVATGVVLTSIRIASPTPGHTCPPSGGLAGSHACAVIVVISTGEGDVDVGLLRTTSGGWVDGVNIR